MDGAEEKNRALKRPGGDQPLAQFNIKLENTPENRERLREICQRLNLAIAAGKRISFGIGLEGDKIKVNAEDLDLTLPESKPKR